MFFRAGTVGGAGEEARAERPRVVDREAKAHAKDRDRNHRVDNHRLAPVHVAETSPEKAREDPPRHERAADVAAVDARLARVGHHAEVHDHERQEGEEHHDRDGVGEQADGDGQDWRPWKLFFLLLLVVVIGPPPRWRCERARRRHSVPSVSRPLLRQMLLRLRGCTELYCCRKTTRCWPDQRR
eukprot:COSAG06_NODE_2868_length_6151_cov_6.454891_4_plen_184_part_00